jgi:TRAP-type C4-dicarboxylate transport system substrate-binding protein
MSLLRILAAVATAALLVSVFPPASAQSAEYEWKFYTFFGANDLPVRPARGFAEDLTKSSGGRLDVKVYTGGELPYKFSEVLRAVATNQVQIGELGMGINAGEMPGLNPFDLPFLCTSFDSLFKSLDVAGPIVDKFIAEKFGVTSLIHWAMPAQQIWLRKPIARIDDLKGRKIRNWNRLQVDMLGLFGASAVTVTSAEVATALDRGVVDGAITATIPAHDWGFYDVAPYGYMVNFSIPHQIVIVNSAEFQKLPKDLQDLVMAKSKEWAQKYREIIENGDKEARRKLAEKGQHLIEPTKEDVDKARRLTKPIWEKWAKETAPYGQQMYEAVSAVCGG